LWTLALATGSALLFNFDAVILRRWSGNDQEAYLLIGSIHELVPQSWNYFYSETGNDLVFFSFDFQNRFTREHIKKLVSLFVVMAHLSTARRNSFFDDA